MWENSALGAQFVEALERRRLLSTVNVLSFGADVNDGHDDSAAIMAAIKRSKKGDTILFPQGRYDIGSTIKIRGDRDYLGEDGSLLVGEPDSHIFKINENNVRVEGLTFDGKPIFIDRPGNQMVAGLVIDNNTFHLHATGDGDNGVTFTTGLRDSQITNNTFEGKQADNAIYGYNWDQLTIANNSFSNGNEGIHIVAHLDSSADLLIEQNYFSGLHRMGIEIQGGGRNTIVQDNYYENPAFSSVKQENASTFAYSIIADRSVGTIVRRNTAIAPARPDGKGVRIVFEIGGDDTLVEENYSVGSNHVLAANDGVGTTSVLAKNNRFINYLEGPRGNGLVSRNNGANVQLSWNINRGKPGPNKRLGTDGIISEDDVRSADQSANPADPVYVSDLKWAWTKNSWGPVERDQSNGNIDAGDGGSLQLDDKSYGNGLGVAADSIVAYKLNGKYSKFFSDIGVDKIAGSSGSVTFEVWLDGKKVYDSGLMTGETPKTGITIDVAGAKWLRLVTTNGGDGDKGDHADWAAARLLPRV